jgi:hypothetical protein
VSWRRATRRRPGIEPATCDSEKGYGAIPYIRRLVAGFSQWKSVVNSREVHERCVVARVAGFTPTTSVSPSNHRSSNVLFRSISSAAVTIVPGKR